MWSSIVKLIMLEMDMILDVSARLDFNSVIDNDGLDGLNFVEILYYFEFQYWEVIIFYLIIFSRVLLLN